AYPAVPMLPERLVLDFRNCDCGFVGSVLYLDAIRTVGISGRRDAPGQPRVGRYRQTYAAGAIPPVSAALRSDRRPFWSCVFPVAAPQRGGGIGFAAGSGSVWVFVRSPADSGSPIFHSFGRRYHAAVRARHYIVRQKYLSAGACRRLLCLLRSLTAGAGRRL